MKTITKIHNNTLKGYEEIKANEKFIYCDGHFEFVAIKIDEEYSAFLNYDCRFILAQKYLNCLSIGSGSVKEFKTFDEAKQYALEIRPII